MFSDLLEICRLDNSITFLLQQHVQGMFFGGGALVNEQGFPLGLDGVSAGKLTTKSTVSLKYIYSSMSIISILF
jgi:hypothetical protein